VDKKELRFFPQTGLSILQITLPMPSY
jgi:hypothetical protein